MVTRGQASATFSQGEGVILTVDYEVGCCLDLLVWAGLSHKQRQKPVKVN